MARQREKETESKTEAQITHHQSGPKLDRRCRHDAISAVSGADRECGDRRGGHRRERLAERVSSKQADAVASAAVEAAGHLSFAAACLERRVGGIVLQPRDCRWQTSSICSCTVRVCGTGKTRSTQLLKENGVPPAVYTAHRRLLFFSSPLSSTHPPGSPSIIRSAPFFFNALASAVASEAENGHHSRRRNTHGLRFGAPPTRTPPAQ
ncbi:hypothetical protein MRX96_028211 [Rhipicephalus microplus]